ncbi:hypothetical protein IMZ48_45445 [Candidatus Bathyarchaeota archaeon]|nr:hypothetical protein [Candidatus Bathyarchaeota archaeon]
MTQAPAEKSAAADVDVARTNENEADGYDKELAGIPALESDGDSHMQDGVKQIEAVTSVWNKKTLWIMMVL